MSNLTTLDQCFRQSDRLFFYLCGLLGFTEKCGDDQLRHQITRLVQRYLMGQVDSKSFDCTLRFVFELPQLAPRNGEVSDMSLQLMHRASRLELISCCSKAITALSVVGPIHHRASPSIDSGMGESALTTSHHEPSTDDDTLPLWYGEEEELGRRASPPHRSQSTITADKPRSTSTTQDMFSLLSKMYDLKSAPSVEGDYTELPTNFYHPRLDPTTTFPANPLHSHDEQAYRYVNLPPSPYLSNNETSIPSFMPTSTHDPPILSSLSVPSSVEFTAMHHHHPSHQQYKPSEFTAKQQHFNTTSVNGQNLFLRPSNDRDEADKCSWISTNDTIRINSNRYQDQHLDPFNHQHSHQCPYKAYSNSLPSCLTPELQGTYADPPIELQQVIHQIWSPPVLGDDANHRSGKMKLAVASFLHDRLTETGLNLVEIKKKWQSFNRSSLSSNGSNATTKESLIGSQGVPAFPLFRHPSRLTLDSNLVRVMSSSSSKSLFTELDDLSQVIAENDSAVIGEHAFDESIVESITIPRDWKSRRRSPNNRFVGDLVGWDSFENIRYNSDEYDADLYISD